MENSSNNSSRRSFLKVAGISALGIGAGGTVLDAFASSAHKEAVTHEVDTKNAEVKPEQKVEDTKSQYSKRTNALTAKRWGMVVDTRKLSEKVNAKIIEACHGLHNVPKMENPRHEIKWVWNESFEHAFPNKEDEFLADKFKDLPFLVLCNHCENPPCVRACPTQATFQREDGIVLMDFHRCIGCRFCMAACPYGSRSFNFRDPRPFIKKTDPAFPTRMKGVVEKCNFCAERLAVGKLPACVEVSEGALTFGDLDDPNSDVRKLLKSNYAIRRKQALGTRPSVYYIV